MESGTGRTVGFTITKLMVMLFDAEGAGSAAASHSRISSSGT